MFTRRQHLFGSIFVFLLSVNGVSAWGDQGKELFEKHCASCHTIGGGDSGGPDLKGVAARRPADWLERVISEPEKLTAEKDPAQAELVKKYGFEMPNLGISRDDAKKIVAFLGEAPSAASGAATPAAAPPAAEKAITVTPELIATGRQLFTGEKRFSKGGAPCGACHAFTYPGVRGANLASDLTQLYEGMGEQGMRGVLTSLKFPIMRRVYADRPLSDGEIAALIAFSKDAGEQKGGQPGKGVAAAGAALFLCIIVGLTLYKRRIG
jgi:mono/diheme cytochrome c family protein